MSTEEHSFSASRLDAGSRSLRTIIQLVLAVGIAVQGAWSVASTSATADEPAYLRMGLETFQNANFRQFSAVGTAPLPPLLSSALPALVQPGDYATSISLARAFSVIVVGIALVLVSFAWLAREVGHFGAGVGAALVALSPNVVAHASLATTDACFVLCGLLALAALAAHVRERSWSTAIALALGLGIALSAKYTAIGLFAVVPIVLFVTSEQSVTARWRAIRMRAFEALATTIALGIVAVFVAWAIHGFAVAPIEVGPLGWRSVPAPIAGFVYQLVHEREGHPAYLLGLRSTTGWWYYMPVALFFKSTPAELLVAAAACCAFLAKWHATSVAGKIWRIAFLVYSALGIANRIDIGVRYVLLLVPLAVFLAVEELCRRFTSRPNRLLAASAILVLLQLSSAYLIAPHYLSYFNKIGGGPANGYRRLVDSNLDWGQDLPSLRAAFERVGARHPLISYFGRAPLDAYGITAAPWPGTQQDRDSADWIAISATNLAGVYLARDPFAAFREIPASDRAAYSILLYATDRPDVQRALAAALARDGR